MRVGWVVLAVSLLSQTSCNCGGKPNTNCVDADGDGTDSCSDCDDADPSVRPGTAELCDGHDNDCDGESDEGCNLCVACPTPLNAAPACSAGACGRGPCARGFFDLDGPATFGCEAQCAARLCTFADGGTVRVDTDPLPETGAMFHALSSGSSYGGAVQTNRTHTNIAVLGEATPPNPPDGGWMRNSSRRHHGGFSASQSR